MLMLLGGLRYFTNGWIHVFIEREEFLSHPPLKSYHGFLVKFVICICIITSSSLLCVCVCVPKEKKWGNGSFV